MSYGRTQPADGTEPPTGASMVGFTALLTAGMAMGTLIAFAVGPLAPFLLREFDLPRGAVGLLTTLFYAVGAAGSVLVGPMADRAGGRPLLVALFGIAAAGLAGMAAAPTFAWVVVAVCFGGFANAAVNPVTNQLISVHVPPGRRGGLIGIKQSGVQVGALYAGSVLPPLALVVGWRGALLATAALALLCAAATVPLLPAVEQPAAPPADSAGRSTHQRTFVIGLSVYAVLMGAGFSAVAAYLPLFAFEVVGYGEAAAGASAAVVGGAGVVARILWGRLAERVSSSPRPLAALGAGAVLAQLAIWASAAAAPLLWVGAVGIGATAAAWNAVGMLAIVRDTHPTETGRVSGVVQLSFYAGFAAFPLVFGALLDRTAAYGTGWLIVAGLYAAATLAAATWGRAGKQR